MKRVLVLWMIGFVAGGCARLFGWDIHAPGILSAEFSGQIEPMNQRVALYVPPEVLAYESKNRGSRFADPQTYHVGEAFGPMLIEGFQHTFDEFISLETEPTPGILRQYGIPYLVVIQIKDFGNRVTLKGQALALLTEVQIYDPDLNLLMRFESRGVSDAVKVFAKKGGPEVNLNSALEQNIMTTLRYLQDSMTSGELAPENQTVIP